MMISTVDAIIRLCIAIVLGGLVGYERQSHSKSAGLRTHVLVALGSCLSMIISINLAIESKDLYGFTSADPTRIAAQVVTGISFLGAGTIMANSKEKIITGLTTAASIWVVAALGLVVGAGYRVIAIAATIMIYAVLDLMWNLDLYFNKRAAVHYHLLLCVRNTKLQFKALGDCFQEHHFTLEKFSCQPSKKGSDRVNVEVVLSMNKETSWNQLLVMLMSLSGVYSVERLENRKDLPATEGEKV